MDVWLRSWDRHSRIGPPSPASSKTNVTAYLSTADCRQSGGIPTSIHEPSGSMRAGASIQAGKGLICTAGLSAKRKGSNVPPAGKDGSKARPHAQPEARATIMRRRMICICTSWDYHHKGPAMTNPQFTMRTGVPVGAFSKKRCAAPRGRRMQPCEAG